MGYVAPAGTDPEADVTTWVARASAGPPYTDPLARSIVDTLTRFHSPFHIEGSVPPAPLFIASGFTDDLFPVDEVTRFANRMRRDHPDVPLSLLLGDFGHQRASNKPADRQRLLEAVHGWLDTHVQRGQTPLQRGQTPSQRGQTPSQQSTPSQSTPSQSVSALTQTCPREAPSEGPFVGETLEGLARGEVRFVTDSVQTVLPSGGDPAVAAAIDPATGGGNACATTRSDDAPGTASYRLPAATGDGFTLLGAPTVLAEIGLEGERDTAQFAARLWDVAPDGASQILVARGLYRPFGEGTEVFQLHPNGYRFAPGHVPRLELVGNDAPYARPSNAPYRVEVRRLELRLPVREQPDCTTVLARSAQVVPAGQQLAPGIEARAATDCDERPPSTAPTSPASRRRDARRDRSDRGRSRRRGRRDTSRRTSGSGGDAGGGPLAFTGRNVIPIGAAGLVLLASGAGLRRRVRRRPLDDLS
jgi:hypothetical protein